MALTKVTGQVINTNTDVTVGVLTVTNNLSVGGTLTYEDVTNIDSVGLITARSGVKVGSGITLSPDGDGFYTGIVTATSFAGDINANNLNVSGIATVGFITSSNAFYTGVVTATTFSGNAITATTASTSTNITVADESSDTTCNLVFVNDPTGAQSPKTGTNLTFNANTGDLAATSATLDHMIVGSAVTTGESGIDVTGIVTATSFSGDGSNLTGISGSGGTVSSGTFTATAGSPSTLETYAYDAAELAFEYTVFVKNGSDYQSQKLLVMRDGTTVTSTQYGIMYSNELLVQLDATISGSNLLLRATPETGVSGSTTYRLKREVT